MLYYSIYVSNNNHKNIAVYRDSIDGLHQYKIATMLRSELAEAIEMVASFGQGMLTDYLNVVYPQTHYFMK